MRLTHLRNTFICNVLVHFKICMLYYVDAFSAYTEYVYVYMCIHVKHSTVMRWRIVLKTPYFYVVR